MKLAVVVPAYNEEKRIRAMLDDYLSTFDESVVFHVVLNACKDNTRQIVEEYQSNFPNRITYEERQTPGKGRAVKLGWEHVSADYVGVADADNATNAHEFSKLLAAIQDSDADGAIASRYVKGAHIKDRVSVLRRIAGRIFRVIVKVLFWLPYKDTQCGAKVFRSDVIATVLPELQDTTMSFDVELLWLCKQHGYRIIEVPTNWTETIISPFMATPLRTITNAAHMFIALIKLRMRTLFT